MGRVHLYCRNSFMKATAWLPLCTLLFYAVKQLSSNTDNIVLDLWRHESGVVPVLCSEKPSALIQRLLFFTPGQPSSHLLQVIPEKTKLSKRDADHNNANRPKQGN